MEQPSLWTVLLAMFGRHTTLTPTQPAERETTPNVAPVPFITAKPSESLTSKQRIAAACAAACVVAVPVTTSFEGVVLHPYRDPAHILTWCIGETQGKPELVYTRSQCGEMLRTRMLRDYAPQVIACVPGLVAPERRHVFAALIDASYNAGAKAVCHSPMAIAARAGQWAEACSRFSGWYTSAKDRRTGKRVYFAGLQRRRLAERTICLTPVDMGTSPNV